MTSFKKLHQQNQSLLLGNVWDVQSALIYEKLGFQAIGTSSAAVAQSLGYEDGENMPFDDYLFIIKRIRASVDLPFSVDLEAGYGKTLEAVVANIKTLHELGVVGINIEDSTVGEGSRSIENAVIFAEKVQKIVSMLKKESIEIFINVRSDAFLLQLPNALEEAKIRIKLYENAGADGIFLPCITAPNDIKEVVASTSLPINVMCMPTLPDFETLANLGVKRISMGDFVNTSIYRKMDELVKSVIINKNFSPLF